MSIPPTDNHVRLERILRRLAPADLDHLCVVLETGDGPARVIATADAVLAASQIDWPAGPTAVRSPTARRQREQLYYLLNDRGRFPDMLTMLAKINGQLGFDFEYAEFRRCGRQALMMRTWARLLAMDEQARMAKVNDFLRAMGVAAWAEQWERLASGEEQWRRGRWGDEDVGEDAESADEARAGDGAGWTEDAAAVQYPADEGRPPPREET